MHDRCFSMMNILFENNELILLRFEHLHGMRNTDNLHFLLAVNLNSLVSLSHKLEVSSNVEKANKEAMHFFYKRIKNLQIPIDLKFNCLTIPYSRSYYTDLKYGVFIIIS